MARRVASGIFRVLVPVVLLLVFAGGVFYVRLMYGPVSVKMLADPIARSLSAELGGLGVTIEDAIIRLTPTGDVEFRLREVNVLDAQGQPIAKAPLAAFSLSGEALWVRRLTPERVVLIEPRAVVDLGDDIRPPNPTTPANPGERAQDAPKTRGGLEPSTVPLAKLDLLDAIAKSAGQASSAQSTRYLKELGVRQATVIVTAGGRQSVHRISEGTVDLQSRDLERTIQARMTVAMARGAWTVATSIEQVDSGALKLTANVANFVPSQVFTAADNAVLSAIAVPMSASIVSEISADGVIRTMSAVVEAGAGGIATSPDPRHTVPFESGRIALRYDPAVRRIDIEPSSVAIDGKRLQFIGAMEAENRDPTARWGFAIRSQKGTATTTGGQAVVIDKFDVDGRWSPATNTVEIARGLVRSSSTEAVFTARLPGTPGESYVFEGRTSSISLEALDALWPRGIVTDVRIWIAAHLRRGRVTSGMLRLDGPPARSASAYPTVNLAVEAADVDLVLSNDLPALDAPRALVRIAGGALEVAMPEATVGEGAKRLKLKQGRFVVPKLDADFPQGEVDVRVEGPLAGALAVLDGEDKRFSRKLDTNFDAVEGKFEGNLRAAVPLDSRLDLRDLRVAGQARITDGKGKALLGGLDVQGATLAIDATDEAVDVRGDLLLQGVPAKLSAQHLLLASNEQQPPIRITATLDAADRNQLGLDVNHLVSGEIPVEILVTRTEAELQPRVQANLTAAEMMIEPLGWRKAPGRPASLQFDLVRGTRFKTELRNFRLSGEDMAISGWMGVDAQNRLREFEFSDFVLNVVSRLEVAGTLRSDNIWDMRVKGPTFDGRDFFRTLLSVGRAVEPAPGARAGARSGLDLKAEIDTVLGHEETSLRGVRLQFSRRGDRLVSLQARGTLDGGAPLDVKVPQTTGREARQMTADSDDAGRVLRLVGFYPNAQGGRMRLVINLDGKGPAEKTGQLNIVDFRILGDPVVYEVLSNSGESSTGTSGRRETRTVRQAIDFQSMRAPFSIGHGQFVLEDADLRGPLLGATLRGKVDFKSRTLSLGGTYVPLQGLNSALGVIPGLGQILAGPRGEGVLGITFAIQGPMAKPQVIVNPLSLVAPGIFREMFQMTNPTPRVTPRPEAPSRVGGPAQSASPPVAGPRSGPPTTGGVEGWRSEGPPR